MFEEKGADSAFFYVQDGLYDAMPWKARSVDVQDGRYDASRKILSLPKGDCFALRMRGAVWMARNK